MNEFSRFTGQNSPFNSCFELLSIYLVLCSETTAKDIRPVEVSSKFSQLQLTFNYISKNYKKQNKD